VGKEDENRYRRETPLGGSGRSRSAAGLDKPQRRRAGQAAAPPGWTSHSAEGWTSRDPYENDVGVKQAFLSETLLT